MKTTLEEELIIRYYRSVERKNDKAIFLTATDITLRLEELSKKVTLRNVGIALKKLGYERVYGKLNSVQIRGYFVIQLFNRI